jgi:hypothetical protein
MLPHWVLQGDFLCPGHHVAVHRCNAPFDYGELAFVFANHRERLKYNAHLPGGPTEAGIVGTWIGWGCPVRIAFRQAFSGGPRTYDSCLRGNDMFMIYDCRAPLAMTC